MKRQYLLGIVIMISIFFFINNNIYAYYILNQTECEGLLSEELMVFMNGIFNYIKILVPIFLLVMGSLDLGKAVIAADENEMKKAQATLVKRVIAGIAIYFFPAVLNVVLRAAGIVAGTCGIQ